MIRGTGHIRDCFAAETALSHSKARPVEFWRLAHGNISRGEGLLMQGTPLSHV